MAHTWPRIGFLFRLHSDSDHNCGSHQIISKALGCHCFLINGSINHDEPRLFVRALGVRFTSQHWSGSGKIQPFPYIAWFFNRVGYGWPVAAGVIDL